MGSFSWTRAEHITKRANITLGDKYKILVPMEFGGGYIVDYYYDYGYVNYGYSGEAEYVDAEGCHFSEFPVADLYGILHYWNTYNSSVCSMHEILYNGDTCDDDRRCHGIDIGCYDKQIDKLKYPLKLVSMSYKGTYEDCAGRSYGDPNQGFFKGYWDREDYVDIYKNLCEWEGKK